MVQGNDLGGNNVEGEIMVFVRILIEPLLSTILDSLFLISVSIDTQLASSLFFLGPFSLELLYKLSTEVEIAGVIPPDVKPSFLPFNQIGLPSLDLTKTLAKLFPS